MQQTPRMASIEEPYFDHQSTLIPHHNRYLLSGMPHQDSNEFLNHLNSPLGNFSAEAVYMNQAILDQNFQAYSTQRQLSFQLQPQQEQLQFQQQLQQQQYQMASYDTQLNHQQQHFFQQTPQLLQFYPPQYNSSFTTQSQFENNVAEKGITYSQSVSTEEMPLSTGTSSVFPPIDAFSPPITDNVQAHASHPEATNFPNMRFYSDANLITQHQASQELHQNQSIAVNSKESNLSLSPVSATFCNTPKYDSKSTLMSFPSTNDLQYQHSDSSNNAIISKTGERFKVLRGVSSGGGATKPPKVSIAPNHHYVPVRLDIHNASLNDLCMPKWNNEELKDRRRIIRIERCQSGPKIIANFSIVGAADENLITTPANPGVDVVEVSCLECYTRAGDDPEEEEESNDNEINDTKKKLSHPYSEQDQSLQRSFYITSVEVIRIVELLIGTDGQDAGERRRERGRIRSNLVSFWSKRPIRSKNPSCDSKHSPSSSKSGSPLNTDDGDFRHELATRIMAYENRKPRGFDKEVRILKWEKLVASLRRALQSYYADIPDDYDHDY